MVKLYNDLAVRLMDAKDYTQALTMLRKAEALLDNDAAWVPAPNGMEPGSSDGALGMGDRNASSSTGALSAFLAADSSVDEVASGYLSTAGYSASGPGGVLAAKRNHLRAITYNNIGCLYKRQARPQDALAYLQNALALEESAGNVRDCASTHLNLCAAYSALDRFKEALSHAEHAIVLLQRQLWGPTATSFQDGAAHLARLLGTLGAADSPPDAKHRARRLVASANVLAMAYHNAAVEHERLGRMREAQVSYSRACTLGTRFLGAKSATTVALNKAHKGFQVRQARQTAGPGHHASGGGATGSSVKKGPSTIASRGMSTTTKIRQTAAPKRASVLGGSSTRAAGAARAKPSATSSLLSTRTSSAMDRAGSKSSVAGRDRR